MELPENFDAESFAWLNLLGVDRWLDFTPAFTLTVVGTPTYVGRLRIIGRKCEGQATLVSSTSIASTSGVSFLALPIPAKGIAGIGVMDNLTSNARVGGAVVDTTNSKLWLPSQVASGNQFSLWFEYEI